MRERDVPSLTAGGLIGAFLASFLMNLHFGPLVALGTGLVIAVIGAVGVAVLGLAFNALVRWRV